MKPITKTLLASSFLLVACASSSVSRHHARDAASEPAEVDQAAAERGHSEMADATGTLGESALLDSDPRNVGDYVTYSFSGAYRKGSLKLTQRVVARSEGTITIDYTFLENEKSDTLRVKMSTAKKSKGIVLDVGRVAANGAITPASGAELEARMAATAAIADENEALVDQKQTTVVVGASSLQATQSTYKVRVGTKSATLETMESDAFAWGDLGGKIVTSDGKLFFKAEVVDAGVASSARASLE